MSLSVQRRGIPSRSSVLLRCCASKHALLRSFSAAASPSTTSSSSPSVSMAMVKQLREQSGAPIVECRDAVSQALAQSSSSPISDSALLSLATDLLRKKGIATASKKSGRTASEGLVAVALSSDHHRAAIVELNSETDFAARNERFQSTLQHIADTALSSLHTPAAAESPDSTAVRLLTVQAGQKSVQDVLTDTVTVLRENLHLRRAALLSVEGEGAIGVYVHNAVNSTSSSATRLGRTVAAVALSFTPSSSFSPSSPASSSSPLSDLANKLAMQITAASPQYVSVQSVPASVLEHERSILQSQMTLKKAPNPQHTQKILNGKMNKFYEEQVMEEQLMLVSVGDEAAGAKVKVREVLEKEGKKRGGKVAVVGMVKFTVGEGVKKDEGKMSFADEVASKLNK